MTSLGMFLHANIANGILQSMEKVEVLKFDLQMENSTLKM